jgi:hypothetical protein
VAAHLHPFPWLAIGLFGVSLGLLLELPVPGIASGLNLYSDAISESVYDSAERSIERVWDANRWAVSLAYRLYGDVCQSIRLRVQLA